MVFFKRHLALDREREREPRDPWHMMNLARVIIRAILAVVLFALACSALTAISLVAMYSDRRLPPWKPSEA